MENIAPCTTTQQLTILIVDDEPINLEILAAFLEDDYQIKVASNGLMALESAACYPYPDLVLLDVHMPDMDGFEVLKKLQENPYTSHIPVMFVTSAADPQSEACGLQLGAVDYITKPLNSSIVRLRVRNYLLLKQPLKQLCLAAIAVENTRESIILTDAFGDILQVNDAFTQMTGYSSQEAIGHNPSFLNSGINDPDFYRALWLSVEQKGYWTGEIWDQRENGEIFPSWLTLTKVCDDQGKVSHYVGSYSDITVLKEANKILLAAQQRLEFQVSSSQEELERSQQECDVGTDALKMLIMHQNNNNSSQKTQISQLIEDTVLPFLKKLELTTTDSDKNQLIAVIENNLHHLVKTYGQTDNLASVYMQLTPTEKLVASLIRQGLSTKIIAITLHISLETANVHRKHLRKKIGLSDKADNLASYLLNLPE